MDIGALWLKEAREGGKKYMSGNIKFPGTEINIAVFKNENKEKDNQPDYRIVWSQPKNNNGSNGNNRNNNDDDIPL